MREFFERLARPEDRSILAVLAIVIGYGVWGLVLGFRRKSPQGPVPPPSVDEDEG